jgi:Mg2+ and Co2+ transporter CorA
VTWIDLHGFGAEALPHWIRDIIGIHPLAIAHVATVPQRPRPKPTTIVD